MKRSYVDTTIVDHLEQDLLSKEISEVQLASTLTQFFLQLHPINRFYPRQEPLPGTYKCRYCDAHLMDTDKPARHVPVCASKEAIKFAQEDYDRMFPLNRPCTHTTVKKMNGTLSLVACGKTFATREGFGDHVRSHLHGKAQMIHNDSGMHPNCFHPPCAVLNCAKGQRRSGITFSSRKEQNIHMQEQHGLMETMCPIPVFCEFCYLWVLPFELDDHAHQHVEKASRVVEMFGFSGVV